MGPAIAPADMVDQPRRFSRSSRGHYRRQAIDRPAGLCAAGRDRRARQQETLARLGERALTESDLQKYFNEVVTTVGEILDLEKVKILELVPGAAELVLRAGIGWHPGLVGTATVSTGRETQAGYTL